MTTPAEIPETLLELERAVEALAAAGELSLPPYPAVALRVRQVLERKTFGFEEIARLVRSDAALAAGILRIANSATYGRGAPVTALTQAVTRVGAQQVLRLLLATGLSLHANAPGPLLPLRRLFWIEGLSSAAICEALARLRTLRVEEAFVLGLLHDFGRIVAAASLERILERRAEPGRFPTAAWSAVADRLHVPLGTALAARWGLPRLVAEAIALHHQEGAACEDPALLEVVRAADQVTPRLVQGAALTAADLVAAPGVAARERAEVARALEAIPDFVAAYEGPATPEGAAPAFFEPKPPPPGGARFAVTVSLGGRQRTYAAVAIAADVVSLVGADPLPMNRLIEVTLQAGPAPLVVWALARECQPVLGGYAIELRPFALDAAARARWSALCGGGGEG